MLEKFDEMIESYKSTKPIREDVAEVFRQIIKTNIDMDVITDDGLLYEHAKQHSVMGVKAPYSDTLFDLILATMFMLYGHIETTAKHIYDCYYIGDALVNDVLNLPKDRGDDIKLALILHDLGKVATPVNILEKPGRYTVGE
jgi:HD-GYP domain-containing protein (c-di-GMP phosphodiesterase class II)